MASPPKELRVFYSWQSDLPKKSNLNAIRNALESAAKRIARANPEIKVVPDEATRDTSGSPNIVASILRKIDQADIFLADVTTVTPPGVAPACPNANVIYELGYAVAQLGLDRIILLFNSAFGVFPTDLPFDLAQNRSTPYRLAESDPASAHGPLTELLTAAITAVMNKNPKRPAELQGLSREKLEHDHDVENLNWLMSAIHLPTLDEHILDLPYKISDRALWFYEHLKGVVENSLFSLYDVVLMEAISLLATNWNEALSHTGEYNDTPAGTVHIFRNPGDLPLPPEREEIWQEIDAARRQMRKALDMIC